MKTICLLLSLYLVSLFRSRSNLVDEFSDRAGHDLPLGVCVGGKARFGLLVEVKHDYLRLVLDFVNAIADLLEEVHILTCLLKCSSDPLVEGI